MSKLIDREAVLQVVRRFAEMMESGAGEPEPGQRLRQVERAIAALPVETAQATSAEREKIARDFEEWAQDARDHGSPRVPIAPITLENAARLLRTPQQHSGEWMLVPVKPTEHMLVELFRGYTTREQAYTAMLCAAPQPTTSVEREECAREIEGMAGVAMANKDQNYVTLLQAARLLRAPQQQAEPAVWRVVRTDTWGDRYWSYGPTQDKDPLPAPTTPYIEFFYAAPVPAPKG